MQDVKNTTIKKYRRYFYQVKTVEQKWLLFYGYNPRKELITNFLYKVGIHIDNFIVNYDYLILIGDFNSEMEEEQMKDFCEINNLQNLVKEPTCLKCAKSYIY